MWIFAVVLFLVVAFLLQGLVRIPADPPHKGVLTFLGTRKRVVLNEGWQLLPFYPWLFGFVPVRVTKVNQDLPDETVRTPDRAELSIQVSLTWTPDKNDPDLLIEFLNSGSEAGVREILDDIARERIREWAISAVEGPQTWKEAIGAHDEATAVLIEEICGLPREEEERKELVRQLRKGNGVEKVRGLGIVLNRLNVAEIKPKGHVAETADLEAKETQERMGEVYEVETDTLKAQALIEAAKKMGEDISLQDAFRIIMEWKTTREGRGFTIPGLSEGVKTIAEAVLGKRVATLHGGK